MPALKNPRPEAVHLAEHIMAKRRTTWAPLHGEVLAGWKRAALAHGYGIAGVYQADLRRGSTRPVTIFAQAGWLIWEGEGWDTRPKRDPNAPLTKRQLARRRMKARRQAEAARAA